MAKKRYKKPTLKKFKEALKQTGGNLSKTAELLSVSRVAIHCWRNEDAEFEEAIGEARTRTFDKLLVSAEILAQGIPEIVDGKIVGWKERPDSRMLTFMLARLGRKEGFGDTIDITTNGKDISVLPKLSKSDLDELRKLNGIEEKDNGGE